jgi:hypothetical protein
VSALAQVTLAFLWEGYAKAVLPPEAPPVQAQECRRAFYAGAGAALEAAAARGYMRDLRAEALRFMVDVEEGRA